MSHVPPFRNKGSGSLFRYYVVFGFWVKYILQNIVSRGIFPRGYLNGIHQAVTEGGPDTLFPKPQPYGKRNLFDRVLESNDPRPDLTPTRKIYNRGHLLVVFPEFQIYRKKGSISPTVHPGGVHYQT